MQIITGKITHETKGSGDLIDITAELHDVLERSTLMDGNMTVFVSGSTAGITTFEYEPGMIKDIREFYEKIAPSGAHYHHDDTWGDANGFSHVRAALTGPSLTIPFQDGPSPPGNMAAGGARGIRPQAAEKRAHRPDYGDVRSPAPKNNGIFLPSLVS